MNMLHRAGAVLLLTLVQPCLGDAPTDGSSKEKAAKKSEAGFTALFDGKSLDGWWRQDKVPKFHVGGKWEVIDSLLVADQDPPGKGGFLATKEKFEDFIIRLEVNMDYPSDSGVFLRMGDDGKSHQVTLDNRPDGQFGKIYLPWTHDMVHASPEGIKYFKQKEWNDVEIRIEGEPGQFAFGLTELLSQISSTPQKPLRVPSKGYVALQVHPAVPTHVNWKEGNVIRYRNIRIKPLKPESKGG